jgi:spoIIIJ-associated protein
MSTQNYEFTGKTVESAIAEGLGKLGLTRQQVEIEILNEGRRGLLGIGGVDARVRLVPRSETADKGTSPAKAPSTPSTPQRQGKTTGPATPPSPRPKDEPVRHAAKPRGPASKSAAAVQSPEPTPAIETASRAETQPAPPTPSAPDADQEMEPLAVELLQNMLDHMQIDAKVVPNWQKTLEDGEPQLLLDIQGGDLGALIGRKGETLADIQFLLRLMVNQQLHRWTNIVVDVEQYKSRREERLNKMALRLAEQVINTGKPVTLEPMPPADRRLVHIALRDHEQVHTQSVGEGERRKVQILPNG